FLADEPGMIGPNDLQWSARVAGSRRASVESDTPWQPGPGRLAFTIDPADFPESGPHRLILQARVRTRGHGPDWSCDFGPGSKAQAAAEAAGTPDPGWELDLPHVPFTLEFDTRLEVPALLGLPDAHRAEEIGRRVALATAADGPRFVPLTAALAL